MEILLYIGILALVILSAVVIYFVSLMPNQKSFDEVKEEQKKKNDAEKKAAVQEAKERALRAKEKKRQKKAAAKEDKRLNSLSTESEEAVEETTASEPPVKKEEPVAQKQVNNKKSEAKPAKQSKPEVNEKKNVAKPKAIVDTTHSREQSDKPKPEPKKKKPEVSSENNQTVQNILKAPPLKEKVINEAPKVVANDSPKEQRVKKEAVPAKKPQEESVIKKEPKVVDLKLKQVVDKAPAVEQVVPVKEEVKAIVAPKEIKKQVSSVTSSPASAKGGKKKKSDLSTIIGNDKEALDINILMPLVAKAELSNTEIEVIIEVLLNKQTSGTTDWSEGRQDPLIKLRKQLEEKEKLLASEKEISKGIQAKLGELRAELNGEKHKVRQLEDMLNQRAAEVQGYVMRIKQISDEKVLQTQTLQSKLNEEHLMLCQLKEQSLKDECAQATIQQDFVQQIQSRDLHIARMTETLAGMEAQMAQMAAQLQEQEAITGGISEEVNAEREQGALLRERLAFQETHIAELGAFRTELEHRLGQAQFEINRLQAENKTMSDQLSSKKGDQDSQMKSLQSEVSSLQEANKRLLTQVKGDQESQLKALQAEVNSLQEANKRLLSQVSSASEKAQQLKDENESLAAQVTANTERPAAEGRENTEDESNTAAAKAATSNESKYLILIDEKENNIVTLKKDLSAKDKDLSKITAELNAKKTEVIKLSKDISQQESIVTSLRSELGTSKSEVADLTAQVEAQKKKNDELRSKNYSIMEGLSKTEKTLEAKIKQSQESLDTARTEVEASTRSLLARLFPQVAPKPIPPTKDSTAHASWVAQFESSISKWIDERSSSHNGSLESNGETPAMLGELEKQNSQLQAMVTKYKSIITDTEGMLNKLQTRVETEETRWNAQIDSLTAERNALEEQVKVLSSSLSNSKSSNASPDLSDELKSLSASLEEEKQRSSDAQRDVQKLKAQLKIGLDSLQAEQKTVEELQAQIAQLKKLHSEDSISIDSNGFNNNEVGYVKN